MDQLEMNRCHKRISLTVVVNSVTPSNRSKPTQVVWKVDGRITQLKWRKQSA